MGLAGAFLKVARQDCDERPPAERVRDFDEFVRDLVPEARSAQASRCMNCGVAFCQSGVRFVGARQTSGCPLHNPIPETNDLVYQGRLNDAAQRLVLTDPFPEFTSRVCPAPCEVACNLGLHDDPVTIHDNERAIADHMWAGNMSQPPAIWADAPLVSVVGSGPAGLACAWRLAWLGMRVRVYERDERPGGLLMYGIPNMKLPKDVVLRRVRLMEEVGIEFRCGQDAADEARRITKESAAVVLAVGAREPRRLDIPGADLPGVCFALDYLAEATRALLDGREPSVSASGKDVVVIGGGDTGTDCVATALRQGATSVRQVVRAQEPPAEVDVVSAWPRPRGTYSQGYGHCEAAGLFGDDPRLWSTDTVAFQADDEGVVSVRVQDARGSGDAYEIPARLVLIAKGFLGPQRRTLEAFGVPAGDDRRAAEGACPVFLAGDARLGPTIVASAMADALSVAEQVSSLIGSKAR